MGQLSSACLPPIDFETDELYAHLIQWRKEKFQRMMNDDSGGQSSPQEVVVSDVVLQQVVILIRLGKVKTQDDPLVHEFRKAPESVASGWVDPGVSTEMFVVALSYMDQNNPPSAGRKSGKAWHMQ